MQVLRPDVLTALTGTVEAIVQHRLASLRVGQNDLWLGLEPTETEAILCHFSLRETQARFPDLRCVSSASDDALTLRNRGGSAPRLLLVIDEPWNPESEKFRQSLQDLSRKDALQLLATPLLFPAEDAWLSRVAEAETRLWVQALFGVLRGQHATAVIRDRDDLPMRIALSRYLDYLVATLNDSDGLAPQAALGAGLWRLGLFSHQTLAERVLARHDAREAIASRLVGPLMQNFRSAHDPDELAERLSSPQRTAMEVLRRFRDSGSRLALSENKDSAAGTALAAFFAREDLSSALQLVEWEFFYRPPGQRTGRGRRGGLRALLAYREALADRREQLRERYLARVVADRREDLRRDIEPLIADLGRGSASRVALEQLERRARDLWNDDPRELERVLAEMQRIHRKARADRTLTRADTLLEALLDVAVSERSNGSPPRRANSPWMLTFVEHDDSLRVPPANDANGWRLFLESSHRALRRAFRNQWEIVRDSLDDGDIPDHVEVELEIRTAKASYPYVLSQLPGWSTTETRILLGSTRLLVDSEHGDLQELLTAARPARVGTPAFSALCQGIHDLAQQLDPCGPFCMDSVASVVRSFAGVLGEAAAGRKAALIQERDALREAAKIGKAAGKPAEELLALYAKAEQVDEQIASLPEADWTTQEARDLGRLQSILPSRAEDPGQAERGPERAWLMPFHPLVLRTRYVRDKIYCDALQQLLDPGVALDDVQVTLMEAFLDDYGQMPPCEVFCPWTGADTWPALRFQRYVEGFAEFAPPATTQADYGRGAVVHAIADYLSLYGAARDRLVLYLEADPDGRAAYHFATKLTATGDNGDSIAGGIDLLLLVS